MKSTFLFFIFYFICHFQFLGQNGVPGTYRTYFGNRLNIKPDSTFEYRWNFDMQSSWTHGRWFINKDTILFRMVPVYDTLKISDKDGKLKDSLILSLDSISEQVTPEIFSVLYSYGQNTHGYPKKLVFKKAKLFLLAENGSLIRKKQKGFWTRKKFIPWYFKYDPTE